MKTYIVESHETVYYRTTIEAEDEADVKRQLFDGGADPGIAEDGEDFEIDSIKEQQNGR